MTRRALALLLNLSLSVALAQTVPQTEPVPTPASATPAPSSAGAIAFAVPVDTLREYRLTEVNRVTFSDPHTSLSGDAAQARAFEEQFGRALASRTGQQQATFKQFLKVVPAEGTAGKYLWNTVGQVGTETLSLRSVRTLEAGTAGKLEYQSSRPAPKTPDMVSLMLAQVEAEMGRSHAELLANFDPASFGIVVGGTAATPLTPGQTFKRLKTLRPSTPLTTVSSTIRETQPIQVEQQLRFEGEKDGQLVFTRLARVVQPGQIVTGSLNMVTTLRTYAYEGNLILTPGGLPISATRDELFEAQVEGSLSQGDKRATFGMVVRSTSALNLTFVK